MPTNILSEYYNITIKITQSGGVDCACLLLKFLELRNWNDRRLQCSMA